MRNAWIHRISLACITTSIMWATAISSELPVPATRWLKETRSICEQDGGRLQVDWNSFVHYTNLNGNDIDDLVLDGSAVQCSTMPSFLCGSGGCSIVAVVDGRYAQEFLGYAWRPVLRGKRRLLAIEVSPTACGHRDYCTAYWRWNPRAHRFVLEGYSN